MTKEKGTDTPSTAIKISETLATILTPKRHSRQCTTREEMRNIFPSPTIHHGGLEAGMPQHATKLRQCLGCYTSATYPLLPLSPRLCSRPGDLEIVRPRSVDYMRICGQSALSNVRILVLERPTGSFSGLDRVTGQSPSPYICMSSRAVGKRLGHHSARVGLFSPRLLVNSKGKYHGRSSL